MFKTVLASMLLASVLTIAAGPLRDYDEACMLSAGCVYINVYRWYCPDPGTYALCFSGG